MTVRTLAEVEATRQLVKLVADRVIRHADDFGNSDALTALSTVQRELEHAGRLLAQVPTIENHELVMRESLRIVRGKADCEEVGRG